MFVQEGILYVIFKEGLEIDLNVAKEIVDARMKFTGGMHYPVIADAREVRSITREGREYFARNGNDLVKAGALVVDSPLTRVMGNVFIYFNRPEVPSRLFTSCEDAREWLRKYFLN